MARATRELALALLEDIRHLRGVVTRPIPHQDELRRASATLRRLLIEGDLSKVAAPRIGKVVLRQFSNEMFYRTHAVRGYAFFANCGVDIGGVVFRGISVEQRELNADQVRIDYTKQNAVSPDTLEDVRLDNFLSQQIMHFNGVWISRRAVIKYVANVASGVHSGSNTDNMDIALSRIRQTVLYRVLPNPGIEVNTEALGAYLLDEFTFSIFHLDPVLAEIHATIKLLVETPSICELEQAVSKELGA